ncbi:MAG: hypothetical protein R3331_09300 [Sulfurospirillaceae bacterium]|nr:hypothetical protein [Sulfurospirillaceae bacterium]
MDDKDISLIVDAVKHLTKAHADTNKKVDKLIESMGKQEVILEKLSNIERSYIDAHKRLHKRIYENENRLSKIENNQINGCPALKSHIIQRETELKHYNSVIDSFDKRIEVNTKDLEEVKSIPNKIMMRMAIVATSLITTAIIGSLLVDKYLGFVK